MYWQHRRQECFKKIWQNGWTFSNRMKEVKNVKFTFRAALSTEGLGWWWWWLGGTGRSEGWVFYSGSATKTISRPQERTNETFVVHLASRKESQLSKPVSPSWDHPVRCGLSVEVSPLASSRSGHSDLISRQESTLAAWVQTDISTSWHTQQLSPPLASVIQSRFCEIFKRYKNRIDDMQWFFELKILNPLMPFPCAFFEWRWVMFC